MIRRTLAVALALIFAAGDIAWAEKLVQPGPLAPSQLARRAALPGTALAPRLAFAALPQLHQASLPLPAQAAGAGEAERAEHARRWDSAKPGEEAAQPAGVESAAPALLPQSLPSAVRAGKPVPMPRVGLARLGVLAGWTALTGLAALTHAPFENEALLPLSIALGAGMGVIKVMFKSFSDASREGSKRSAAPRRAISEQEAAALREEVAALAGTAGLPRPTSIDTVASADLNAAAQGWPSEYTISVYGGVLDLPPAQKEAVLRHELAHIRHGDSVWTGLHHVLSAVAPTTAMLSGIADDRLALLALPFAAASTLALAAISKISEVHADQYAAASQGSVEPMISGLREMELRDAASRAAPAEGALEAWTRRAARRFDKAARMLSTHPSNAQRIRRLQRLAGANE